MFCNSCSEKKEVRYGFIDKHNEHRISIVKLDLYEEYSDLVDRIQVLSCLDSIPTIKIETKEVDKLVALYNPCLKEDGCILIKQRNKLRILNDSIQVNRSIAFDSIDAYMHKHFINEYNSEFFSENPRKALVTVEYKKHDFKNLVTIIDGVTEGYSNLSLELPLVLILEGQ